MPRRAMIAAVGLDSASVRIDGVKLRNQILAYRKSGLEQDSAVAKNVSGKVVFRTMRQRKRVAISSCALDYEVSANLFRVNDAIFRQVKRADASFSAIRDSLSISTLN